MKLTSMYSNFLRSPSNLTDLSTSPPKADAKETNPTQRDSRFQKETIYINQQPKGPRTWVYYLIDK